MAAKKRAEEGQMVEVNADPFAFDMSKVSGDFSMEALLKAFNEKNGESATRKYSINERIVNARKNIARIQAMICNLEIKQQSESGTVFLNLVVRPVADELRNAFPNARIDVFGPFGLSGQATITVGRKGENPAGKGRGADARSVTLVPTPEGMSIRDYSQSTDEYAPGSPEYLSGLNHPLVPVPTENPLEFIANWLVR